MKSLFKKIISILLVVLMLSTTICSANATDDLAQDVNLEIVNDSTFAWGDTITFTVTITNNTGSRIVNVNLLSEPKGMSKYFQKTDDSTESIDFITPGASRTVEIIYSSDSISSVKSFFRSILTFFKQFFAKFSREYSYIKTLKIGKSTVLFGIDVEYELSNQVNTGNINLDDPDPDVEIYSFGADVFDIHVGETQTVTFKSEIFENTELEDNDVKVVDENNELIAYLKDDGVAPDVCENDGIFTASVPLSSDERKNVKYFAECNGYLSDGFEICYYTDISNDDYKDVVSLVDYINELENLQDVENYLSTSSIIETYSVNDVEQAVSFTATCGISGTWEKDSNDDIKGTEEFKNKNEISTINNSAISTAALDENYSVIAENKSVLVIRPYIGSDSNFTQTSRNVGNSIAESIGGLCRVVDDQNVTVDFMKTLDDYGTVIVDSHGTVDGNDDPFIIIGETMNTNNIYSSADWQSSRIIVLSNGRIAVGGNFFDTYYEGKRFQDTIFFLGTCYSMHNRTISDALLSNGAAAVYGFSEPVRFTYCDNVLTSVFTDMVSNGSDVQQAYDVAGNRWGFRNNNCEFRIQNAKRFSYFALDHGNISGVIKNASTGSAVSNALIRVYKNDDLIASTRTNSNGSYNISIPSGNYIVKVSAGGFKTAKMAVTVRTNSTTYNETFLLIFSGLSSGYANGSTINAITGQLLPNVNINIRKSWNNYEGDIVQTISSNDRGYYEVSLPAGLYTLECYKDGCITTYKNILIFVYDYVSQNISIAPELEDGYYRVVLTWGENPRDLDSHIFGETSDYSYHVYYSNKNGYDVNDTLVANLDVDDVTSYGPETTTFYVSPDGEYDFYVDWYAGSGTWASSGGKVEVYNGAYLINTYYVPNVSDNYGSWKVFSIKNGIYTDYNIISEDIY